MLIAPIQPTDEKHFDTGLYLVVLHAGKIPPHLGLFLDGFYYSSAAHKSYVAEPISGLLKTIQVKKIPVLFVELAHSLVVDEVKAVFSRYGTLEAGQTCLNPIREVLDCPSANFVFELIGSVLENNLSRGFYGLNLELNTGNSFELPHYTLHDVYLRIDELRQQHAQ